MQLQHGGAQELAPSAHMLHRGCTGAWEFLVRGPDDACSSILLSPAGWPVHPDTLLSWGTSRERRSGLEFVYSVHCKIVRTCPTYSFRH